MKEYSRKYNCEFKKKRFYNLFEDGISDEMKIIYFSNDEKRENVKGNSFDDTVFFLKYWRQNLKKGSKNMDYKEEENESEDIFESSFVASSSQDPSATSFFSSMEKIATESTCELDRSIEYSLGVDEAGRGPVLGPIVLSCFYTAEEDEKLKGQGFADSKKLKKTVREKLFKKILESSCWGFKARVISAEELSNHMLQP